MNTLYDVDVLKRDKRTASFQIFATDRDDAIAFIKRVLRNTLKEVTSARRATKSRTQTLRELAEANGWKIAEYSSPVTDPSSLIGYITPEVTP